MRRANSRLYAVAECSLEPNGLAWLTENKGELRWSTSTNTRVGEPLRIDEISLTTSPATIGLPPVRWWKLDVVKGNLPAWVQEDLAHADKTEFRSRHELRVHDLDYEKGPYSDFERYRRDVGLSVAGSLEDRHMTINGERVPIEHRPARIISVDGLPVRRS